ncbi:MAG: KTSC domain-containing protein [Clostridiales bacterium]|jgi:hypothetical protein|nr:KTSC domain-containing protein [Clostridiales bacterium]
MEEYRDGSIKESEITTSNITKISWSNDSLLIYFADGCIIKYLDIPEGIYAGLQLAHSKGSFLRLYVCGKFSYIKMADPDIKYKLKELQSHYDFTVGLWATDRPDLIPKNLRHIFFRITE